MSRADEIKKNDKFVKSPREEVSNERAEDPVSSENRQVFKGLFIDIIRHDLLNPVCAAYSALEYALEDEKDPKREETLRFVRDNIERAIDIIDDTSVLSQAESRNEMRFLKLDLGEVLRDVHDQLRPAAKNRNIILNIPEGKHPVTANHLIQEVFSNLISNAIKYSPRNSEIRVDVKKQENGWVISVSDEGEGIPDEDKLSIFSRFQRREKNCVEGIGLGLAIVKRIVEIHNGRVWVEDNPLGGSVFVVYLPEN